MSDDLPVSTIQIDIDSRFLSYDGSPAENLASGVVKRKIRMSSGQVSFQYLDKDGYVIPDFRKYKKALSELDLRRSARIIQNESNKLEVGSTESIARTTQNKELSERSVGERIDAAAEKAMRNKEMIRLDEAFPDVGLYDGDPSDPSRRSLPMSPAIRARQASLHGQRYQKEYILRTVHRLSLRRVPVDQIAQMFNVQVSTVYNWLDELRERLKSEATTLTITQIAGDTLSFYNEARAMGLTIASTADKVPEKVRGMEVALKAEADKHKFLQAAGFYETAKLGRDTMEDESARKARSIINMTKNLLSGKYEAETPEEDISDMISPQDKVLL